MAHRKLTLITALAFLFVGAAQLLAAPDPKFSVVALDKTLPDGLYVVQKAGGTPQPLQFLRNRRGPHEKLEGRQLSIVRQQPGAEGEAPVWESVAQVTLDAGRSRWLLVFEQNGVGWNVLAIPDDAAALPADTLAIFNATNTPVEATIGDLKSNADARRLSSPVSVANFHARASSFKMVTLDSETGRETTETIEIKDHSVPVRLTSRGKHLFEAPFTVTAGQRYLLLVAPTESETQNPNRPRVLFLSDQLPEI